MQKEFKIKSRKVLHKDQSIQPLSVRGQLAAVAKIGQQFLVTIHTPSTLEEVKNKTIAQNAKSPSVLNSQTSSAQIVSVIPFEPPQNETQNPNQVQFYSSIPRINSGKRKETLITIRFSPLSKPDEFGRLLISERAKRRLGLKATGKMIGISGTHLMELEQGYCAPSFPTAIKISEFYGLSLALMALGLKLQTERQGKKEKRVIPGVRKPKRWQMDLETFEKKKTGG